MNVPATAMLLTLYDAQNVLIDWGGASDCPTAAQNGAQVSISCDYAAPGDYTLQITGTLDGFGVNDANVSSYASGVLFDYAVYTGGYVPAPDRAQIRSVQNWGNVGLTRLDGTFMENTILESVPTSIPASVISLNLTFNNTASIPSEITSWNTSNIQEMAGTFSNWNGGTPWATGASVETWSTQSVRYLTYTFAGNADFNQNIGGWDVSNVRSFSEIFQNASTFNADLSAWDVTGATLSTSFSSMFGGATSFNQDLSGWCVSGAPNPPNSYFDDPAPAWVLPRPNWASPPC